MRTLLIAAIAATSAALSPTAFAQVYVSGGYTVVQADAVGSDVTLGAVTIRAGHDFNPFLALEGEASFGVKDDSYTPFGSTTPVNVSLDNQLGVYAVGKLPLPGFGTAFARAGYVNTSVDDPGNEVDDGDGLAFGGGLELDLIPGLKTRLEYTDYTQTKVQTFGVSAGLRF